MTLALFGSRQRANNLSLLLIVFIEHRNFLLLFACCVIFQDLLPSAEDC